MPGIEEVEMANLYGEWKPAITRCNMGYISKLHSDVQLPIITFADLDEGAIFELDGLRLIKNVEMNEGSNATVYDNPRQSIRIEPNTPVRPVY